MIIGEIDEFENLARPDFRSKSPQGARFNITEGQTLWRRDLGIPKSAFTVRELQLLVAEEVEGIEGCERVAIIIETAPTINIGLGSRATLVVTKSLKRCLNLQKEEIKEECGICQEDMIEGDICAHFHKSCISEWIGRSNCCPYCRREWI